MILPISNKISACCSGVYFFFKLDFNSFFNISSFFSTFISAISFKNDCNSVDSSLFSNSALLTGESAFICTGFTLPLLSLLSLSSKS